MPFSDRIKFVQTVTLFGSTPVACATLYKTGCDSQASTLFGW